MTLTLESIKAEQSKLAYMIARLEAQAGRTIDFPAATITLAQGEHYAGIIIGEDNVPSYHLILLQGAGEDMDWSDAKAWAVQNGGDLPNRREQSLLYANCKDQFSGEWYWSSEAHEDSRYAWAQYFGLGHQDSCHSYTDDQFWARAVRRLVIE